jgi:hypothetical protein
MRCPAIMSTKITIWRVHPQRFQHSSSTLSATPTLCSTSFLSCMPKNQWHEFGTYPYAAVLYGHFSLGTKLDVPEHDSGRRGELDELPKVRERLHGETLPRQWTPATDDLEELAEHHEPPRQVGGDDGPDEAEVEHVHEQVRDHDVHDERDAGSDCGHPVLELALQESGERQEHRHGEVLGQQPDAHLAGEARQLRGLPDQQQQILYEDVGRRQRGGEEEDDPRALQVHAQHVVLLRAERLPAQRLQRARHAQLRITSKIKLLP